MAGAGTPDGYNFGSATRSILTTGYADSLIGFIQSELGGQVLASRYGDVASHRRAYAARPLDPV